MARSLTTFDTVVLYSKREVIVLLLLKMENYKKIQELSKNLKHSFEPLKNIIEKIEEIQLTDDLKAESKGKITEKNPNV